MEASSWSLVAVGAICMALGYACCLASVVILVVVFERLGTTSVIHAFVAMDKIRERAFREVMEEDPTVTIPEKPSVEEAVDNVYDKPPEVKA